MNSARALGFSTIHVPTLKKADDDGRGNPPASKATAVDAPRTMALPVSSPAHPAQVLEGLVSGGFIDASAQRSITQRVEADRSEGYDLTGALSDSTKHLCTGTLGALGGALSRLPTADLTAGERTARGSLLFWVRSEIVGGGTLGAQNAKSFDDY